MDIKTVLVPVDFSPPSRLAVNCGIPLARAFRARLVLLHVIEATPAGPGLERQHTEQACRMMSSLVAPEDQDDLDLLLAVNKGEIEQQILTAVAEQHAGLVVMGTHGRGLIGRWVIGSVTQNLLRKVSVPVLTVCRVVRPLRFRKVLFASDLTEAADGTFKYMQTFCRGLGAGLAVVHAIEPLKLAYPGTGTTFDITPRDIEEARANLSAYSVESVVKVGVAAEKILEAAEELEVDLIAIGAGRKGLVERALLGSTAERIIRESHLPVLVVPQHE